MQNQYHEGNVCKPNSQYRLVLLKAAIQIQAVTLGELWHQTNDHYSHIWSIILSLWVIGASQGIPH